MRYEALVPFLQNGMTGFFACGAYAASGQGSAVFLSFIRRTEQFGIIRITQITKEREKHR